MKRREMVENIASELIHELTGFMSWNRALDMADIVLSRIEKEGMTPPYREVYPVKTEGFGFQPEPKCMYSSSWEPEK